MQVTFKTEVEAVSFLNTVLLNDRKATLNTPLNLKLTAGDVIRGAGNFSKFTINFQPRKIIVKNGKKIIVNSSLKECGISIPENAKVK